MKKYTTKLIIPHFEYNRNLYDVPTNGKSYTDMNFI